MRGPISPTGKAAVRFSAGFTDWMASENCSLVLSTYELSRLFFLGRNQSGSLSLLGSPVEKCQGLWTDGQTLWSSGLHTLTRYTNNLSAGQQAENGVDCLFAPRESRITGQIDIHDIAVGDLSDFGAGSNEAVFVSAAFNCLGKVGQNASFCPVWQPPFITEILGEDRCHLNGLAMDGSKPAYVTVAACTNNAGGWRDHRANGGAILELATGETVATDLSMPHSPRLYDGKLWVLDTGNGSLVHVDPQSGQKTEVVSLPGFARGLAFVGRFAVVGLSRPRANEVFQGLHLEERLKKEEKAPICGIAIVDIDRGQIVETIEFGLPVNELYDVAVLPGIRQPDAIIFGSGDMCRMVRIGKV